MQVDLSKPNITAEQRNFIKSHPDFALEMDKRIKGMKVATAHNFDSVYVRTLLSQILSKTPFINVNMLANREVDFDSYTSLVNDPIGEMETGTATLAIKFFYGYRPADLFPDMDDEKCLANYLSLITMLNDHQRAINEAIIPICEDVIYKLHKKFSAQQAIKKLS